MAEVSGCCFVNFAIYNKLFSGLALGPSLRTLLFAEAARSINMEKVNMLPLGK